MACRVALVAEFRGPPPAPPPPFLFSHFLWWFFFMFFFCGFRISPHRWWGCLCLLLVSPYDLWSMSLTLHFGLAQHNFLRSLRVQLLLTFSETNLLDFSESASPAAPLAARGCMHHGTWFRSIGESHLHSKIKPFASQNLAIYIANSSHLHSKIKPFT